MTKILLGEVDSLILRDLTQRGLEFETKQLDAAGLTILVNSFIPLVVKITIRRDQLDELLDDGDTQDLKKVTKGASRSGGQKQRDNWFGVDVGKDDWEEFKYWYHRKAKGKITDGQDLATKEEVEYMYAIFRGEENKIATSFIYAYCCAMYPDRQSDLKTYLHYLLNA